ncbi:MAG: glycosyltransferase family 39 protein [Acidobacteria bacterium]|nr:glycosyltransferase family 39 protein [Acidobacteriota bacterium]
MRITDWVRKNWASYSLGAVIVVDIVAGLYLRFSTNSHMWLDEVLTVNIAQGSYSNIIADLRHDGAPPLFYFVLHHWMQLFGSSDSVVRSLSGVLSVITLPLVYVVARRLRDRQTAAIAVAVASVTPYAIYFATETRMYSMVMCEVALFLFVWTAPWKRRDIRHITALALITSSLLYTHYWTLYFTATVMVWSLWHSRDGVSPQAFVHRQRVLALAVGAALWLPWVGIFNEQRVHTGTPWANAPTISQFFTWVNIFAFNQSVHHMTPSLHHQVSLTAFVGLLFVGLFAVPLSGQLMLGIDLRIPRTVRFLAITGVGSVTLGLFAAKFANTTFVPRYAAIGAIPILLLVAVGISNFRTALRILLVMTVFSGAMLWTDKWGRGVQRTQAGQVAAVLATLPSSTTVLVCPDQLGPSLLRYARQDLTYISYPRGTRPDIIDWYDYTEAFQATSPEQFARGVKGKGVAVVWANGYNLHSTCRDVLRAVANGRSHTGQRLLAAKVQGFYQSMNVTYFP